MTILDEKECFGSQSRDILFGEPPDKCLDCDLFEKCHKITIAACLQTMSEGIELIIQNLLTTNQLKSFNELEKINKVSITKIMDENKILTIIDNQKK